MPNVIDVIRIWRPKFILWCDVRHQEVQRERHELAERHGADCTALGKRVCIVQEMSRLLVHVMRSHKNASIEARLDT